MQIENAIPWWNVEVLSFAFHLTFREPTSLRIWIENNLEGLDFYWGGIPDKNLQSLIGSFTDPSRAVIKCHNVLKYIY